MKYAFRVQSLIPSLTSGLVIGILEVALAISFAALIFSGSLTPYVSSGIGYVLVGAIIGGTIIALFTSWPGFVGGNQDVPAAIFALMASAIVGLMPASATAEQTFITVVVTIALTTFITGLFLLGAGYFKLGGLARFLPYPVVGGFLAGTGWLLITGAVTLMADLPGDLFQLPALFQSGILIRWLPGVLLAVVILVVTNRVDHYLVLPVMLLISTALFFLVAWLSGYSTADLSAGGWLLGPFAGEGLWQPLTPAVLSEVYWPAVVSQAAGIAAIVLVSTASMLLNAGGVELAVNTDIDLDKELRVAGLANMLTGFFAGLVGFHQLSFSILNYKIGANNRLTGMVGVAVCALALVAGASLLALFPKIIVGTLLFLLGLSLIVDWVVEGWSKLPHIDYAIVLTILLATAFVGFLEAVALGLLMAVVLFVVGYSRVDVVRHELSAATYHSRVVRSPEDAKLLLEHGEEMYLLQLQGFIFFGTADSLYNRVCRRMNDERLPRPTAVVLDFERVSGLDTTAMISFSKMENLLNTHCVTLVLCGLNERVQAQFEDGGLCEAGKGVFCFEDVDHAVAWCERGLLARWSSVEKRGSPAEERHDDEDGAALPLVAQQMIRNLEAEQSPFLCGAKQKEAVAKMLGYFQRLDLQAGTQFISQGRPADILYFLAAGQTTARLLMPDGSSVRLETMSSGRIIGEVGFFLGGERTADVIADKASTLFYLTADSLARMENEDPEAAALLYRLAANVLAERVTRLTSSIKALER